MSKKDDDFRICDNCEWFTVHPSGVSETCQRLRMENRSNVIAFLDPSYIEKRINGEATTCKRFKKLTYKYEKVKESN